MATLFPAPVIAVGILVPLARLDNSIAPPFDAFRRVHLPLLAPSAFAAGVLVFVDVMKELPATLVLRPFNFDTLAVVAYQLAAGERPGEAALPSLTIVLAGVIPVFLLSHAISRTATPLG